MGVGRRLVSSGTLGMGLNRWGKAVRAWVPPLAFGRGPGDVQESWEGAGRRRGKEQTGHRAHGAEEVEGRSSQAPLMHVGTAHPWARDDGSQRGGFRRGRWLQEDNDDERKLGDMPVLAETPALIVLWGVHLG